MKNSAQRRYSLFTTRYSLGWILSLRFAPFRMTVRSSLICQHDLTINSKLHLTDYHRNSIEMLAILKRCAVFLLLALTLLLLNTIEVSEKCECGLEKGHLGKHQAIQRGSVQQLVEWQRLKQQRSHDWLK